MMIWVVEGDGGILGLLTSRALRLIGLTILSERLTCSFTLLIMIMKSRKSSVVVNFTRLKVNRL